MKYEITDEFQKRFFSLEFKDRPVIQYNPNGYFNLYFLPFLAAGIPYQIWWENLFCYKIKFAKDGQPIKTPRQYLYRYWEAVSKSVGYTFNTDSFSVDEFNTWCLAMKTCDYAFEIPKDSILMELVKSGKKTHSSLIRMVRKFDKRFLE